MGQCSKRRMTASQHIRQKSVESSTVISTRSEHYHERLDRNSSISELQNSMGNATLMSPKRVRDKWIVTLETLCARQEVFEAEMLMLENILRERSTKHRPSHLSVLDGEDGLDAFI